MRGQPIPINGAAQVLAAYKANDIGPWAIFAGKEMFLANDDVNVETGASMLAEALDLLGAGGSEGTYILRVYDTNGEKITYKTDPCRGFPFKLYEEQGSPYQRNQKVITEQAARIERLEAALLEAKEDDEEEEGGVMGMINGLIAQPQIQQAIVAGIANAMSGLPAIIGKFFNMNNGQQPGRVAGINVGLSAAQQDKVEDALELLSQRDPQLGDHLFAIAQIAVNNPAQYNMLLGMLPKA